jgi:putative endopeptidase
MGFRKTSNIDVEDSSYFFQSAREWIGNHPGWAVIHRIKRLALGFFCVLPIAALPQTAPPATRHVIVLNNLDRAVAPGDDFFLFANGAWLQRTQIPPGRGEIGNGVNELVNRRITAIVEDVVARNGSGGDNQRKIADLYASYMNEKAIEDRGLAPFQPELRKIAAIRNRRQLARALGETLRSDVDPLNTGNYYPPNFLGFWSGPGFDDPGHYTAHLLPGGLGLPVEEFYLSADAHMREVLAKYQAHVAYMLRLSGFTEPERRAARVVELERAMAEKHRIGGGSRRP